MVDAAADYAQQIPMRVIADMLGFPPQDGPQFREFAKNTLEGINLPPQERVTRMSALFYYLLAQVHDHLASDALVAWGWAPGANRTHAPGSQAELAALFQAWIDTGAVCP